MKLVTLLLVMVFTMSAFLFAEDVKNAISEMEFFEVFSGTWVNEDYSGMFNWLQKVVFFPMADGKNIILLQTTSLTIMGNTQWMTCG